MIVDRDLIVGLNRSLRVVHLFPERLESLNAETHCERFKFSKIDEEGSKPICVHLGSSVVKKAEVRLVGLHWKYFEIAPPCGESEN